MSNYKKSQKLYLYNKKYQKIKLIFKIYNF